MSDGFILEMLYLGILLLFSVILISSDNKTQYITRYFIFYIIFTLIYELIIVYFVAPNFLHTIFIPGNILTSFLITFLSLTASSFGAVGIISQSDEELRDNWEINSTLVKTGTVIMGIFLILFIWFVISLFFDFRILSLYSLEYLNRIIAISMYRLLFFLFFVSGFYVSRNIRDFSDRKKKFLFILSFISLFLAIFDGIFNISIRWPFLYINNIYFGFFFIFQSIIFVINISKAKKASISTIMWISLFWLIAAFFFFENNNVLTEFPIIFPKWLIWLYIIGFLISFRYKVSIKSQDSLKTQKEVHLLERENQI
jgi:hypothetical protein